MNHIDKIVFEAEITTAFVDAHELNSSAEFPDPYERDRKYFMEGVIAALTLLKNEEFSVEKLKEEFPVQCSLFSSAMSAYINSSKVAHDINKIKLEEKIKHVLGGML